MRGLYRLLFAILLARDNFNFVKFGMLYEIPPTATIVSARLGVKNEGAASYVDTFL